MINEGYINSLLFPSRIGSVFMKGRFSVFRGDGKSY